MNQSQHSLIATILIIITAHLLNLCFPFSQEEKYWGDFIKKLFDL